jgi:cell division protein FtsB
LRIDEAEKTFSLLDEKKMSLESRVRMLRPDSLDPDMLEEQSRKLLYFSHKDDIIVILNDKKIKS